MTILDILREHAAQTHDDYPLLHISTQRKLLALVEADAAFDEHVRTRIPDSFGDAEDHMYWWKRHEELVAQRDAALAALTTEDAHG